MFDMSEKIRERIKGKEMRLFIYMTVFLLYVAALSIDVCFGFWGEKSGKYFSDFLRSYSICQDP